MAINNPAFTRQAAFSPNATPEQLQALYNAPSAGASARPATMTVEGAVGKSFISFVVLVLGAAIAWMITASNPAVGMSIVTICGIVAFVLALVNIFKREPSPVLILGYALTEGAVLGAISMVFDAQWSGIVMQAVLATLIVVGVTLALFMSGKIRASAKATKIFMIGMVTYVVFSLVNLILSATGVVTTPFGLNGVEVFGIPLGILIGLLVVLMGAYSLVLDFDFVQRGVNNRAPAKYEWTGAFSILMTVVWLYLQILQMLALSRD
jgi:uncharacterized YccA/Bax inhibitor family protein